MQQKTIIVKLGTSVLTAGSQHLNRAQMVALVHQCVTLHHQGHKLILVTSGAGAAGREHLGFKPWQNVPAHKQMLAAVGQSQLMLTWQNLFNLYELHVGQMLLTRADLEDRERFLNARDTLQALIRHRIIPIINENDAVATTEIKVGDNDNLSARVAILANADLLVLLTDQDGLYTTDPRINADATLIPEIETIDASIYALAGDSISGLGTGGMTTKLQAAQLACRSGIEVVITRGQTPDVLSRLIAGESLGTRFKAEVSPLESRKSWILAGPPPCGKVLIDDGAVHAVRYKGSSLLPKGITTIDGMFHRGDAVRVLAPCGNELARGISRYSSQELNQIKGNHSDQIGAVLGYGLGAEAIHRDDLVLL